MGCLAGAAVGDALGGATEGWSSDAIRARYGGWVTGLVPAFEADVPADRRYSRYRKGDGRITDDTIMTQALVEVYESQRRHLDAYDIADRLVPILLRERRWIPDMETHDIPLQRLFLAEKWLVARLHHGHIDPREGGAGNMVNCGAAMYMAPVGIANAADPRRAYAEAVEITGAHQTSFGREAAGVMAAAVAAAMAADATPISVVDACLRVARDGTRSAIEDVARCAQRLPDPEGGWEPIIPALRAAIAPWDTVGDDYRDPGLGARLASRLHAIEELPVALGFLIVARGEYATAVLGAANYGRDADSIAAMAGAVAGALGGLASVPAEWREVVARESRIDLEEPGRRMAAVAREIRADDRRREEVLDRAFAAIDEGTRAHHLDPA
jgi:ADP-ribosylglycohydrolase